MKSIRSVILTFSMLASVIANTGYADRSDIRPTFAGRASQENFKIGVVDSEMAVLESDVAKKYAKTSEALFGPRIKKLKTIQESIKAMEQELQKDRPVLTELQKENRQLEIKRKYEDLQLQDRQLRMEKNNSDQSELGKLKPKLEKAVEEVTKIKGYDLVLEKGAVRFVRPEYDITRKVIQHLNQMK